MAGSQLKRLKASLRGQGRLGPTKSKKEKKSQQESRRRQTVLHEAPPVKAAKFDFLNGHAKNGISKDNEARERREQARKDGIRVEMQRKQKVGGINDRRFGEDNPTMTPEERALERYVRVKQRIGRKAGIFDLEEDDEDGGELTHLGRPLNLRDDFQDSLSDASEGGSEQAAKRRRITQEGSGPDAEGQENNDPDRPKTKKEIMEEVIAKSKLHKYERQKTKEDDDDLRAELDAGVADIFALMKGYKPASQAAPAMTASINPDRAALISGNDREQADRDYDMRLRAMVQDKRSQPTTRTKTEEELAQEAATKLQRLEEQRLRRMNGEELTDDEVEAAGDDDQDYLGEEMGISLPQTTFPVQVKQRALLRKQDVEDEDEFELDDGLIASDSDDDSIQSEASDTGDAGSDSEGQGYADSLTDEEEDELFLDPLSAKLDPTTESLRLDLAFTYPCPQNLQELLAITEETAHTDLPVVIQRIRALYHPGLAEGNKTKLAGFASALVEYIAYLPRQKPRPSFAVLEKLIRHIHSLARSYSNSVSEAFREQLRVIHKDRPTALDSGDLIVLTAIGSIYPTSDHFHQVVTPSTLTIARYLAHNVPKTAGQLATGAYLSTLALAYQRLSKRFIPEALNYVLISLDILSPESIIQPDEAYPRPDKVENLRIMGKLNNNESSGAISFWIIADDILDGEKLESVKLAILVAILKLVKTMTRLWSTVPAYPEIMSLVFAKINHLSSKKSLANLPADIQELVLSGKKKVESSVVQALETRRPLTLHNHRPLAIKMSVPKFEDSYDPEKRYDPDTERAESSKLRAEHKKERKSVIREFRKEARAEAAVQLEEKKARDEAYEKKYRRLVAEIQGEEGREANAYEREKAARKRKQ